jgi:hypothetical protein
MSETILSESILSETILFENFPPIAPVTCCIA